ncbi:hypothetical protein [Micromonospora sp. NPDC005174]|uniref:hypothetical protein n=1 Tax=Micromonospora sp. NPDC005174 TaxID=3157018 RepID=UPI0033A7D2FD
MTREPSWYTVVIDVVEGGEWTQLEPPTTQATELNPQDLADVTADGFFLSERAGQWQVRVFEGYNRFDNLLTTLRDGDV